MVGASADARIMGTARAAGDGLGREHDGGVGGRGLDPAAAEADGSIDLANGITLRGKADRIDRSDSGALAIIDYKTGVVPSHAQVEGGFALQMGLLGWLAEEGRLAGVDKGRSGRCATGSSAAAPIPVRRAIRSSSAGR